MKLAAVAFAAAVLISPAALAQTAPAPAPAHYDLDTPIETLVADPAACAVIDKDMPHLRPNPAYDEFKGMSLHQLQPMSQGQITDDILAKVAADLKALPTHQ